MPTRGRLFYSCRSIKENAIAKKVSLTKDKKKKMTVPKLRKQLPERQRHLQLYGDTDNPWLLDPPTPKTGVKRRKPADRHLFFHERNRRPDVCGTQPEEGCTGALTWFMVRSAMYEQVRRRTMWLSSGMYSVLCCD